MPAIITKPGGDEAKSGNAEKAPAKSSSLAVTRGVLAEAISRFSSGPDFGRIRHAVESACATGGGDCIESVLANLQQSSSTMTKEEAVIRLLHDLRGQAQ